MKGWSLDNIMNIEQCKDDTFVKEMREHANEGCQIYGHVEVAKVINC